MLTVKTMIKLRRLLCAYVIVQLSYVMRMEKTDQAAQMRSSCCRNTAAVSGHAHICAYNPNHWIKRSLNRACIDRLLDNHVVISDSRKS